MGAASATLALCGAVQWFAFEIRAVIAQTVYTKYGRPHESVCTGMSGTAVVSQDLRQSAE
jgi:hypothetical protein